MKTTDHVGKQQYSDGRSRLGPRSRPLIPWPLFGLAFLVVFAALSAVFVMTAIRDTSDAPGEAVELSAAPEPGAVLWTEEAEQALTQVPWFVRDRVREAAERNARDLGLERVTPDLLSELRPSFTRTGDE